MSSLIERVSPQPRTCAPRDRKRDEPQSAPVSGFPGAGLSIRCATWATRRGRRLLADRAGG
jgi:hypothetical protein